MLVLVGQLDSPFVRRVAATMTQYGLSFDPHNLSVFGDRAEVMRLNPLGKVPALILDDGETLIESALIIDYLDELANEDHLLTPRSGARRRQILRIAAIASGISERAVQLRSETVRRPINLQSPEFIEAYIASVRASLDFLERTIDGVWSCGDTPTHADFAITASLGHLSQRIDEFSDLSTWPKLAAVREAGEKLEAFRANPFIDV
jgi:glutathione S-transferase